MGLFRMLRYRKDSSAASANNNDGEIQRQARSYYEGSPCIRRGDLLANFTCHEALLNTGKHLKDNRKGEEA